MSMDNTIFYRRQASSESLRALDRELGTRTQEAFQSATRVVPDLGSVAIDLDEQRPPYFVPSLKGLPGSKIVLHSRLESYQSLMQLDAPGHLRSASYCVPNQFLSEPSVSAEELVMDTLLHLLGHAYYFQDCVEQTGDIETACITVWRSLRAAAIENALGTQSPFEKAADSFAQDVLDMQPLDN